MNTICEKITPAKILEMKRKDPISALTAYDYPTALILGKAGVHIVLVGDSLGMVVLGYPDTTYVTMEEMVHHTRAVARSRINSLIAADMPYKSYDTVENAVINARRLVQAGAEAVKLEGGRNIITQIKAIIDAGIPVIGHIGMLPQSIIEEGGYHIKGRSAEEKEELLADASALAEAGVFAIVLELVYPILAAEITKCVKIPTIGIGSGVECDGQILVSTDLFGTSPGFIPKHVKIRGNLGDQMLELIKVWKQSLTVPK
jgi:3-methyl-2-oxobutanoate hydroxymethyltransferase